MPKNQTSLNISKRMGFHEALDWLDNKDSKECKEHGTQAIGNVYRVTADIIRDQAKQIDGLENLRFNNSHKINVFEKALKLSMETFKQNETENGCPESGVMAEHISELLEQI